MSYTSQNSNNSYSKSDNGKDSSSPSTARTHYLALRDYLEDHLAKEAPNSRANARDKLTRLSKQQFQELSTDVYDELTRRSSPDGLPFLPVRNDFHPKRNQARQKLATLPKSRFKDLAGDVFYELERRYPDFKTLDNTPEPSPGMSEFDEPSPRPPPKDQNGRDNRDDRDEDDRRVLRRPNDDSPRSMDRRPSNVSDRDNLRRPNSPIQGRVTPQSEAIIPNKSTMVEEDDGPEVTYKQGTSSPSRADTPESNITSPNEVNGVPSAYYDKMSFNQSRTASQASSVNMTRYYNGLSMASNMSARSNGRKSEDGGPDSEEFEKMRSDYEFRIATMQDKITALEREIKDVQSANRDLKLDNSNLKDDIADHKDRLDGMGKDLDRGRRDGDKVRKLEEDLERQMQINKEQLADLRKLEDDLESHRDEIVRHRDEREELIRNHERQRKDDERMRSMDDRSTSGKYGSLQQDYDKLQDDYRNQQDLIDDVRKQSTSLLDEIKALSERNEEILLEREHDMAKMQELQNDMVSWRKKYEKAKTELRNLKATSTFYAAPPQLVQSREGFLQAHSGGAIEDIKVTAFQVGIDDLLTAGRSETPTSVLANMKPIIMTCKGISEDIDFFEEYRLNELNSEEKESLVSLKNKLNATLSNLMTAAKNHASGMGMSPISLLDAAASHLAVTIVDLCKLIRVRPSGPLEPPAGVTPRSKTSLDGLSTGSGSGSPLSTRAVLDADKPISRSTTPTAAASIAAAAAAAAGAAAQAASSVLPTRSASTASADNVSPTEPKPASKWFAGFGRSASKPTTPTPPPRTPSPPPEDSSPVSAAAANNPNLGGRDRLAELRNPVTITTTDADGKTENVRAESPAQRTMTPEPERSVTPTPQLQHNEYEDFEKLKSYLEQQTEAIVQSIQSLLSAIRSGSFGPTLSTNLTQIITIVTRVVAVTRENFSNPSSKAAAIKSRGDAILQDLEASCERLSQEMQRQEDDRELSKASKQKMASASFDIARYLKELVQLFEDDDDDYEEDDDLN